jgi:hypothetical protein
LTAENFEVITREDSNGHLTYPLPKRMQEPNRHAVDRAPASRDLDQ